MSENHNKRKIEVLSDVEHITLRPNVYIGSIKPITENRYIVENNKFIEKELTYIPGLVKIFEEILDNSVDAFVDYNFPGKPKIDITLNETNFKIIDNGVGIPNEKHYNKLKNKDEYMCESAWGTLKAGSNFDDNRRKSAGANGMGSFLSNIFSKKFIGINKNNGLKITCEWQNNSYDYKMKESKISSTGVEVYSEPDFKRFSREKFEEGEMIAIKSRIIMLALTYPEIKFVYNGEVVNVKEIEF